jgi:hypothetical protein
MPWSSPPLGWVKFTIDISFHIDDKSARICMALCDDRDFPIFTSCSFLAHCDSPFEVELRACVEVPLIRSGFLIINETGCSKWVDVVKSVGVHQIKLLTSQGYECVFVKAEQS